MNRKIFGGKRFDRKKVRPEKGSTGKRFDFFGDSNLFPVEPFPVPLSTVMEVDITNDGYE